MLWLQLMYPIHCGHSPNVSSCCHWCCCCYSHYYSQSGESRWWKDGRMHRDWRKSPTHNLNKEAPCDRAPNDQWLIHCVTLDSPLLLRLTFLRCKWGKLTSFSLGPTALGFYHFSSATSQEFKNRILENFKTILRKFLAAGTLGASVADLSQLL